VFFINYNEQRTVRIFILVFSFLVTSTGMADRCIIEDPPSTYQPSSSSHSSSPLSLHHQLSVQVNNHRSLSTVSSIDPTSNSMRNSISSTRRPSTLDSDTQRVFERQQKQERLANIRTTLTLFVVTAIFILMYLPSIIITLFSIKPHGIREVLFLFYYINSAVSSFSEEENILVLFYYFSAIH
jgi:hypothetical protein